MLSHVTTVYGILGSSQVWFELLGRTSAVQDRSQGSVLGLILSGCGDDCKYSNVKVCQAELWHNFPPCDLTNQIYYFTTKIKQRYHLKTTAVTIKFYICKKKKSKQSPRQNWNYSFTCLLGNDWNFLIATSLIKSRSLIIRTGAIGMKIL